VEQRKDLGCETGARAQLMSNLRISISGSSLSEIMNGDREQCLERAHNRACAQSQAAERFQRSLSANKEREIASDRDIDETEPSEDSEGRDRDWQERGWGRTGNTKHQRGRAVSPLHRQSARDEEWDRKRVRERDREPRESGIGRVGE